MVLLIAPEVIRGESYDYGADWWSLGVLMYDMLSGHPPFRHKNQATLQKKILNDKVHFPKYLSSDAVALMRGVGTSVRRPPVSALVLLFSIRLTDLLLGLLSS
jgi:serine/threonine protein kinase